MIAMPSYSVNEMRRMISKVYDSPKWREKVRCMYDNQVIAIFYAFLERGRFDKKDAKMKQTYAQNSMEETGKNGNCQLTFDDIFGPLV